MALAACSTSSKPEIDPYEVLAAPPQLIVKPLLEAPSTKSDKLVTKGLGDKAVLHGPEEMPKIEIDESFDNTWQLLEQILRNQKITVTDRNRDKGYWLVNFDLEQMHANSGFWHNVDHSLFGQNLGLRKYQITVRRMENKPLTEIRVNDLGAITRPANKEEKIDELVDANSPAPQDSQMRLLSVLFKRLHDGFEESVLMYERLRHE